MLLRQKQAGLEVEEHITMTNGSLWRLCYEPRTISGARAARLRQYMPFKMGCSSDL